MSNFPNSLAGGRYLLVKQLGEGGMATVFRAFDQRLQVWRAIKILSSELSEKPRLRQRFESEAQTMALLEHKHIVRIYDVGNDADFAYIVMEIVEGGSLVDWLERHGAMPPRLAVDVTIETCEGLSAAHAKGVVHRDIKPHNVMVTREGSCRVTDFGIAQVNTADQNMTRTGAVMGTWGYMAPEQRTNAKTVDPRADVYSTAAMLYTLLTNKMPMDLFASDRDDEMLAGVHEIIVPVLVKATEYKRENRYNTIIEFAEALRSVRASLPPNPPETPALAKDPGPPPAAPPRGEMVGTEPGGPIRRKSTSGTMVPSDELRAGATLVGDDGRVHAPTMAPSESDTMDGEGPRIKDRPLYDPANSGSSEANQAAGVGGYTKMAFVAGSGLAVALVLVGVGLVGVAGVMYAMKGNNSGVAVADTPDVPALTVPPVEPKAPPKVAPDPGVPTAPPLAPPVDPKAQTKVDPKLKVEPKPGTKPEIKTVVVPPDPVKVDPQITVVVPAPPQVPAAVEQCVKLTPPASASVGSELIVKSTLCVEDGTEVTLWYRPVGGTWQSKLMPKALGSHTTKLTIDPSFTSGLELYVEAGAWSKGSRGAPISVPVR